jgi:hypothetical protein
VFSLRKRALRARDLFLMRSYASLSKVDCVLAAVEFPSAEGVLDSDMMEGGMMHSVSAVGHGEKSGVNYIDFFTL